MPLEYLELLKLYARRGIAEWLNADHKLRMRALACLAASGIADTDKLADETIGTIYDKSKLRLPMKVVTDSDLIPVSDSDVMPVAIGAKRRWHDHSGRTDRHPSTGMQI